MNKKAVQKRALTEVLSSFNGLGFIFITIFFGVV